MYFANLMDNELTRKLHRINNMSEKYVARAIFVL